MPSLFLPRVPALGRGVPAQAAMRTGTVRKFCSGPPLHQRSGARALCSMNALEGRGSTPTGPATDGARQLHPRPELATRRSFVVATGERRTRCLRAS